PWLSRVACVPDDTLFTCTNTQPPLLAADDPLNSWASLVSRSTFSGELTTGMVAHPFGALVDWLLLPTQATSVMVSSAVATAVNRFGGFIVMPPPTRRAGHRESRPAGGRRARTRVRSTPRCATRSRSGRC